MYHCSNFLLHAVNLLYKNPYFCSVFSTYPLENQKSLYVKNTWPLFTNINEQKFWCGIDVWHSNRRTFLAIFGIFINVMWIFLLFAGCHCRRLFIYRNFVHAVQNIRVEINETSNVVYIWAIVNYFSMHSLELYDYVLILKHPLVSRFRIMDIHETSIFHKNQCHCVIWQSHPA